MQNTDQITIRGLAFNDLPAMMECEEAAWPADVRATEDQLRERLEVFPEGCFGAWKGSDLVGMTTCQLVNYQPSDGLISWSDLCADGSIRRTHQPAGNCVHFISTGVRPEVRGHRVGTLLNQARLELGRAKGADFALADTRLPGMARFLAEDPGRTAQDYLDAVLDDRVHDPVVRMYRNLGLEPLGLIASCMKSDVESAHYGLGMIYRYHRLA
ncbi:GNAT family N-acetyltransferase [Mycolicibacterium hodleri]|uniref:GNAT family N-acetyltransferase n=1 Tax=Mycolicibacterium hodleri TaxID=49897 RepID=A0A502EDI3_9MYCO|nr:GNAT family N-acetyltransferase [Mycolicibacterium hodleri]TPG35032.1 GNAT family N-acetyltransferase [Mycolicibacterium hodleri]